MSNKTFLITMEDSCFMTSMGWCVCGYGSDKFFKCDGELEKRPEWCPLVAVEDRGENLLGKRMWREE